MCLSPPVDALAWLDQSIEEAHESLANLSDALSYLYTCALPDELPGEHLPSETEEMLLAEQRRCLLAAALIRRLEGCVHSQITRLRESQLTQALAPVQKDVCSTCCLDE